MKFTPDELKELGISAIVIGFVFAWIMRKSDIFLKMNFLIVFVIMLIAVGTAFICHELAHKAMAQKHGCWAEYRMWETGLIIAFFLAVTIGIVFAAPGAVYIEKGYYPISRRESGIISVAGPSTNLLLAIGFLMLSFKTGVLGTLGNIGFLINTWLALFNMIPFPPLDGSKVIRWSPIAWGAITLASLALLIGGF